MRIGSAEHEGLGPLGIGRGEEHAHGAALGGAEHRRALAASRVHDGAHMVHALLEGRACAGPVGEAGAALVEDDHSAERPEARQEMRHRRMIPVEVDVGDEAGHVDEVERTLPEHLVGNSDLAALRVVGVGLHGVALQGCADIDLAQDVRSAHRPRGGVSACVLAQPGRRARSGSVTLHRATGDRALAAIKRGKQALKSGLSPEFDWMKREWAEEE